MKIGKLILRARMKQAALARRGLQHTFDNYIGGSVELAKAQQIPAQRDLCFIVPLGGSAETSNTVNYVDQILYERFAAIVCLKSDAVPTDEYGVVVYDRLHDIRDELLSAFVGWQLAEAEGVIMYKGESLLDYDSAYLWYQFEFEYPARVLQRTIADASGINADGTGSADYVDAGIEDNGWQDTEIEEAKQFKTLYTQYVLVPDAEGRIPKAPGQGLPLPDGFPDVRIPNIAQWVDENSVEESEE